MRALHLKLTNCSFLSNLKRKSHEVNFTITITLTILYTYKKEIESEREMMTVHLRDIEFYKVVK